MTEVKNSGVTRWLSQAPTAVFSGYAMVAAFATYFCMYAFRKPFAVALFAGEVDLPLLPPINYKILLIISQVMGYALSKWLGIKVISEMSGRGRALAIVVCIGAAELALLLFAVTPAPWSAVWMFANGLPLGMVWGLVFGFLEGRRVSELLGAGLSASYMVASGFVKSVGQVVMNQGVSEVWMPAVTGAIFFPFMLFFVWALKQLPAPTAEDEAQRTRRVPMDGAARIAFVKRYAPGLLFLTFLYMFLTAYRDFRDNFAREIWEAVGQGGDSTIYTASELPVAFGVLLALALVYVIKSNRRALIIVHQIMIAGSVLIGVSTLLFQLGVLGPVTWMILVGLGCYLGYVPFGCVLFDRLIAAVGVAATAGFMIYVTDACGYLGSICILLYKTFGQADLSWLDFFITFSYVTSGLCTVSFLISMVYFRRVVGPDPA